MVVKESIGGQHMLAELSRRVHHHVVEMPTHTVSSSPTARA